MVSYVVDFILDNPNIMLSIAVFLICVIIGFFGDRRFKKNGTLNKITKEENEETAVDNNEKEESVESKIEDAINAIATTKDEPTLNDNIYENKMDNQNDLDFVQSFNVENESIINPYENNSMNPLVRENESFNQETQSSNINASGDLILPSDDEINNMF